MTTRHMLQGASCVENKVSLISSRVLSHAEIHDSLVPSLLVISTAQGLEKQLNKRTESFRFLQLPDFLPL